jgi:hypothetical protein
VKTLFPDGRESAPATLFMTILFNEHAPVAASQTASIGVPKNILPLITPRLVVNVFNSFVSCVSLKSKQPKTNLRGKILY